MIRTLVIALACLSSTALAANSEPLPVTNLSPLLADRLLPVPRSAMPSSGLQLAVDVQIGSHFIDEQVATETLFIDGESSDVVLDLRYGLADRWDLQLRAPWRRHSTGFLDGLINDWHDFFGMPDGGRSRFPESVLAYRYTGPDADVLLETPRSGWGDPTFAAQYTAWRDADSALALAAGVSLGVGEPADLTGSGGDEAFLVLRFSGAQRSALPLYWHGQLGYSRAQQVDVLAPLVERGLWFGSLSVDWQLAEQWSLLAQVDGHSAAFDSQLDALGDPALLLSLGARWRPASRWSLEVGFSEDIAVETAPDIVFFSRLRYAP